MEENEFYIEESNPKKTKLIIVVIILIISVLFVALLYYRNLYTLNVKNTVTYEVGEKLDKNVLNYLENKVIDEYDYRLNLNGVPTKDGILNKVGKYTYKVKYKSITKKGTIEVVDTKPPVVEVTSLTVGVKEDFELDEFITKCEDYSKPCNVLYKNEKDEHLNEKAGDYTFNIVISDVYNNKVTKRVKLEVKKNYSREKIKKKDLKVDHIEPDYKDWNNEMILTYSEGVDANKLDEDSRYTYLLDLAGGDLSIYLPSEYMTNVIEEAEIIFVYNKYDYVIGFAVRVKLDNGKVLYLTK